jgi:hypothetical protein
MNFKKVDEATEASALCNQLSVTCLHRQSKCDKTNHSNRLRASSLVQHIRLLDLIVGHNFVRLEIVDAKLCCKVY